MIADTIVEMSFLSARGEFILCACAIAAVLLLLWSILRDRGRDEEVEVQYDPRAKLRDMNMETFVAMAEKARERK
jgi:hypothetical protein